MPAPPPGPSGCGRSYPPPPPKTNNRIIRSISITSLLLSSDLRPSTKLFFLPCYEKHNTANKRHCARDRRQRHVVCLFASGLDRSNVNNLFISRAGKPSPRQTKQARHNQDYSSALFTAASFGSDSRALSLHGEFGIAPKPRSATSQNTRSIWPAFF